MSTQAEQPRTKRGTDRRVGMTQQRVTEAAIELSLDAGLDAWSIRDLAGALDVAPSVIYHHAGGRDAVLHSVLEHIVRGIPIPARELGWEDWFREFLTGLRPPLVRFPGAAKWLLMHGPAFPGIAAAFDAGIGALTRAGFARPAMSYAMLVNTALLTISMSDERQIAADDGPRDHETMRRKFAAVGEASPGISQLLTEMLEPLATSSGPDNDTTAEYYRLLLESLIAGLAAQLALGER